MPTPPTKPFGRSLSDFAELLPAEKLLRDAVRLGELAVIGTERPSECTPDNEIRAGFLRFLALGGDEYAPVHEKGISADGAWITGELNLTGCVIQGNLGLTSCHFCVQPILMDTEVQGALSLDGSELPGINAGRLRIKGSLFMGSHKIALGVISKFKSRDTINIINSKIQDSLVFQNGHFDSYNELSINADGACVGGSVFFNHSSATKSIRLSGIKVGGNLSFDHAELSNETTSLSAERMKIDGSFQFRNLTNPANNINISSGYAKQLSDDTDSWGDNIYLTGFVYDLLSGSAPCTPETRLNWISRQPPNHYKEPENFKPQPWKQLIRTLRKMGHEDEARQVAIAYETHRRQHKIIRSWVSRCFHFLFGLFIAYGYRPLKLFFIMIGIWFFCAGIYWTAALHDVFAPSNPLVFNHKDYQHCSPGYQPTNTGDKDKFGNWYLCPQLAGEYTGFSPLAYSLDLLLPLVDLQQEHDWAPYIPTPKATWHEELLQFLDPTDWKYHWTRVLVWFEILFGWVASLLLVAVVSGLTNRDKDD